MEQHESHPKLEALVAQLDSEDVLKGKMDRTRSSSSSWGDIIKTSDFALLTNKVALFKNILQIIQQDDKATNTMEFSQNKIHICSRDDVAVQEVDLLPEKMGKYSPPTEAIACTFQCSKLLKFFRPYQNNIIICISKNKGVNVLQITLYQNNAFASDIVLTLESEDNVQYIQDTDWEPEPHMMVNIADFSNHMKYARQYSSADITGFAKYMCILSEHKVNKVTSKKVYGLETGPVVIENVLVSKHWERLVRRRLEKMKSAKFETIKEFKVVVLNHPITVVHANVKLMTLLSKLKPLTKTDHQQMLFCHFHKDLPMKMNLTIKDGGATMGEYKIFTLGSGIQMSYMSSSPSTIEGVESSASCKV